MVLVTRLDNGDPWQARVSRSCARPTRALVRHDWTGRRRHCSSTPLRITTLRQFAFVVLAEKDGDVAYVGSDWNEGIRHGSSARITSWSRRRGSAARCSPTGGLRLGEENPSQGYPAPQSAGGRAPARRGDAVIITVRDSKPGGREAREDQRMEQREWR